jgi:predicted DsbA family dithiol-disulfide isomerase
MQKEPLDIVHYSDVLCVWAYIAQARMDELQASFPDEIAVNYRFLQVFGDVAGKLTAQWADRGGLDGYALHVQDVAAGFEHISINKQVWLANTPTSSLPAHLLLCGAKKLCGTDPDGYAPDCVEQLLAALRQAFFVDLVDISSHNNLLSVAEQSGIKPEALQQVLNNGLAHAQLAADLGQAAKITVRASPTLTFNDDRQVLTGNVGYRVIEANVRELLRNPSDQ